MSRTIARLGFLLPIALVATSAAALITSESITANADVLRNSSMTDVRDTETESNQQITIGSNPTIYVYDEKQCIEPQSVVGTVPLDTGDWQPNKRFSCHIVFHPVYHDPLPNELSITLSDRIIGFVSDSDSLDDTDGLCDTGSLMYPGDGDEPGRGLNTSAWITMPNPFGANIYTDPLVDSESVRIITECSGFGGGGGGPF